MIYIHLIAAMIALSATAPQAHAGLAKVKMIEAGAEEVSPEEHDRLVAVLTYDRAQTTQACGNSGQPQTMRLVFRADRTYSATETRSRLVCADKRSSVVREQSQTKRDGQLEAAQFARLLDRLSELVLQPRGIAGQAPGQDNYRVTIQLADDLRGVLTERHLALVSQAEGAAQVSAQFMQRFVQTGKLD